MHTVVVLVIVMMIVLLTTLKNLATERFEKKAYLCIQLEEYAEEDGSDEDLNYKEECDKILEDMDYFKKKEILKKYD